MPKNRVSGPDRKNNVKEAKCTFCGKKVHVRATIRVPVCSEYACSVKKEAQYRGRPVA